MKTWQPIITIVLLLTVLACGITAANYWSRATVAEDDLKEYKATVATGRCGNQQIVVIDERRVAVAGKIISPAQLPSFRFEGSEDDLRVLDERGQVVMSRRPR